jgi:thiol-disulfide isomerase/thioredoxin
LPVVEQLASEFHGQARVVTVDADRDGELLKAFGASSFPTYLVFENGVEVDRLVLNFIPLLLESRLRGMIQAAVD